MTLKLNTGRPNSLAIDQCSNTISVLSQKFDQLKDAQWVVPVRAMRSHANIEDVEPKYIT